MCGYLLGRGSREEHILGLKSWKRLMVRVQELLTTQHTEDLRIDVDCCYNGILVYYLKLVCLPIKETFWQNRCLLVTK